MKERNKEDKKERRNCRLKSIINVPKVHLNLMSVVGKIGKLDCQ